MSLFVACSGDGGTETVTVTETVKVPQPATYSVVFLPNGAEGEAVTQSFAVGTAQNLRANTFTRAGYSFALWNTARNGSGTNYADGESVKDLASENGSAVLLYAQWVESATAQTFYVSFNANGGTGSMSSMTFTYNEEKSLLANIFTRTGYTFAGWAVSASGTKAYTDGESVKNLAQTEGATVTLYAVWSPIGYAITVTPPAYSDMGEMKASVNGSQVTFTAPQGYSTYEWYIDDEAQTAGAGKSEWTLDVSSWTAKNYFVEVIVTDASGNYYSARYELAITK